MYQQDAQSCPHKLRELTANRSLLIKAKIIEGMTPEEAQKDFEIVFLSTRVACEFATAAAQSSRSEVRRMTETAEQSCPKG